MRCRRRRLATTAGLRRRVTVQRSAVVAAAASITMLAACGGGGGKDSSRVMEVPQTSEVRVIDADTVDIDGTRYRLSGIDAPEAGQTCRAWGRTWDCGVAATDALATRAEGMRCEGSDTDRFGRTIGVCGSGGEDLNAWLVANGWALAYRQYSRAYVGEEAQARSNRRGIHRGEFIEPWRWRAGERLGGVDTFSALASGALDVGGLADRMLRGEDANVHGGWLDESVFAIVDDRVATSFGAWHGTNPTVAGGATWTGAFVAMDARSGEGVEGDAVVDIDDFAAPDVDIALFVDVGGAEQIRDRVADLRWDSIPVWEGTFSARDTAGWIEGRFYGGDHEEVGGIFERDHVLGAFGGRRTR